MPTEESEGSSLYLRPASQGRDQSFKRVSSSDDTKMIGGSVF